VISPARYYHTKILIDEISQNACQSGHVTRPENFYVGPEFGQLNGGVAAKSRGA